MTLRPVAGFSKEEYLAYHKQFCDDMLAVTARKNADYTGASADPFANFTRVEALGIASTEQGFLTRMTDKLCRVTSLTAVGSPGARVSDESIRDTLHDLANYCALFAAYLESKKRSTVIPSPTEVIIG